MFRDVYSEISLIAGLTIALSPKSRSLFLMIQLDFPQKNIGMNTTAVIQVLLGFSPAYRNISGLASHHPDMNINGR